MFISKEIPAGLVNGVNKTYTLANLVNTIDDVFVDGAIYLGVITVVGAVITLADAPTASIFVDYWTAAPVPPPPTPFPGLINLTQARQSLLNRKKDLSDVSQTVFIEWCQFVQDFVYRKLKDTDSERYIQQSTITVVPGTIQYDLPANFGDAATWQTGMYKTNPDGNITDIPLPVTAPGSTVVGYYISGASIFLTPNPQASGTYIFRYTPAVTRFVFMSDYFTWDTTSDTQATIPSEYMLYLVNALDVAYDVWDEDVGAEIAADQRFVRSLSELLDTIRRSPATYAYFDYSTTY